MLNIFKRLLKKNKEYQPVNRLEELLFKAAHDRTARAEFLRQLFHFDLFVLGHLSDSSSGQPQSVQLLTTKDENDMPLCYAYTSKEALEFVVHSEGLPPKNFVCSSARAVFEMINGKMGMILNLGLSTGKIFSSDEIKSILSDAMPPSHTIPANTPIKMGQPRSYPKGVIEALKAYVQNTSDVKDIYIGLKEEQNEFSLIGIVLVEEDRLRLRSRILQDISAVCSDLLNEMPLDLQLAVGLKDDYRDTLVSVTTGARE